MTPPPADAPGPQAPDVGETARRRSRWWRLGTPAVVLLSGALFAVSAHNSGGTDLRPGRYTDLSALVQSDADGYRVLQERAAALNEQVDALGKSVDDAQVRRVQRRVAGLRGPAGLEPVSGPGVTVVLSDAPHDVLDAAYAKGDIDLNRLLVHQQDIQAVVNALWAGGATAVTIQGQRIVSTTGIKCTGNSVQLQGVPYPEPYTIQAVGDPAALESALGRDASVELFREDAERPDIAVGYEQRSEALVKAAAYDGLVDLSSARPLTGASSH